MLLAREISAGAFILYAIGFSFAVANFLRAVHRQKENLYVFIRVPELMVMEQVLSFAAVLLSSCMPHRVIRHAP
jgi:hypothetical protein